MPSPLHDALKAIADKHRTVTELKVWRGNNASEFDVWIEQTDDRGRRVVEAMEGETADQLLERCKVDLNR